LNFVFEAHIPGGYIPDSRERLRYYRALSSASSDMELREYEAEIRDRFGPLPDELDAFFGVLKLKRTLSRLQAARAELYPGRAVITWKENAIAASPERLIGWVGERSETTRLLPPAKLEIRYSDAPSMREALETTAADLEGLLDGEKQQGK
jgi:transcription-repair coupling factor (superfamily II helicase)